MVKIASTLAAAVVVTIATSSLANAQISSEELFRRKHERDAQRASESFNNMWQAREARLKAQREAEGRAYQQWRRGVQGPH